MTPDADSRHHHLQVMTALIPLETVALARLDSLVGLDVQSPKQIERITMFSCNPVAVLASMLEPSGK
jgi:hypothetical protein